ncbi:MAG TPA: RecX family transcriptional regulator [Anaeromyxobacteraceae bacterium]|nr:RecX family transcriptional regulator [Anaeromyxobacteraceae bacterium]
MDDASTPLARARALALRFLAARARTEAQVRARLERAAFEPPTVDEAVAWLHRLGYLDDAAYARARARALLAPGRLGPRMAERRLVAAGVPQARVREAIAEALAGGGGGGEGTSAGEPAEVALCRELARRRSRSADPAALDDRARQRLARFLLGRGFAGSVVARVVGLWLDAEEC